MNGHDPRGRAGSRTLSDTVGRLQERPSRGQLSPVGGHVESLPRDRSHYGSPSQQESAVGSPATSFAHTRVDTPVRTPHQSYTPTRLDTPSWEVKDDRWTPGRSSEKRSMDPGSLPSRSQGKRSNSPASRGEPLSYHPDHSSPAASPVEFTPSSPVGYNLALYQGGQAQRPEQVELREPRMVVSMTMSEYQHLMTAFDAQVASARGVGREEGVSIMEVLIVQLTDLLARMYREGQLLNEEYQSVSATLNRERQIGTQKIEATKRDLHAEAQAWIATTTSRLEQQVLDERTMGERAFNQEREAARNEIARQIANQTASASRELEEAKRVLTENFHQQQSALTARLQEQAQRRLDEYRRDVEITALQARTTNIDDKAALANMEATMKNHREACEAEFQRRAAEYRDELIADGTKGMSQLQAVVERLRSENSVLTTQRDNQASLDSQEQRKSSHEAYEKTVLQRELQDLKVEKEKFRESYNQAVHEINRVTRENERLVNETSSPASPPSLAQPPSLGQLNLGAPVFGAKSVMFSKLSDPNQGAPAESNPYAPYKIGAFPMVSPMQGRDPNLAEGQARNTGHQDGVQHGWHQPGVASGTVQQGWQTSWGPGSSGPAIQYGQGPPQGNAQHGQGASQGNAQYGQGPPPGNDGNRPYNGGPGQAPNAGNQNQGGGCSYTEQSSEQGGNDEWQGGNNEWTGENIPKHLVRKEAEKIVFPPFPDVISWRAWKTTAIHAVVQASARPDPEAIIEWIK